MANFLVTYRGSISDASWNEIFIHTLAIQSNLDQAGVAATCSTLFKNVFGNSGVGIAGIVGTKVKYLETTAAGILDLNTGALTSATHVAFSPNLVGVTAGLPWPPQISLAVSLWAGPRLNGVPIKGRFNLPIFAPVGDAEGRLSTAGANLIRDWAVSLLTGLKAAGCTPCVWSGRGPANAQTPKLSPITLVKVGNQFDTIRTRRNKGAETYVQGAI